MYDGRVVFELDYNSGGFLRGSREEIYRAFGFF